MAKPSIKQWEIVPSTGSHFEALDGLRGAAILLVAAAEAETRNQNLEINRRIRRRVAF